MQVLLTGSSGWLGRHLAPLLAAHGHDVVGLDVAPGPATRLIGSVADRALIETAFTQFRPQAVIHAGALHQPDLARFPAQAFLDTNASGTLALLEAAVAHKVSRFVLTSTTSLMVRPALAAGGGEGAEWMDEDYGPLAPRNIYGISKLAAEQMCAAFHAAHALPIVILRTARFFAGAGEGETANARAIELLHRRLTVEDAARAHLAALDKAPQVGFGLYVVSAPTPFERGEAAALGRDAAAVIARHFPSAPRLFERVGWSLPKRIDRVYDSRRLARDLGFTCRTDFAAVLAALETGAPMPFPIPSTPEQGPIA